MTTADPAALAAFREASSAVAAAHAARNAAREAQILADRNYDAASDAWLAAMDRLEAADQALRYAPAQPTPPSAELRSVTPATEEASRDQFPAAPIAPLTYGSPLEGLTEALPGTNYTLAMMADGLTTSAPAPVALVSDGDALFAEEVTEEPAMDKTPEPRLAWGMTPDAIASMTRLFKDAAE